MAYGGEHKCVNLVLYNYLIMINAMETVFPKLGQILDWWFPVGKKLARWD